MGLSSTTLGSGVVVDGRFAVKRLLGIGGTSAVYVAEQRSMGRDVALKVLRHELLTHDQVTERFLREARAVSRLTNPHTISVYDVGRTEDGMLYIAMELLKGRSLFQAMVDEPGPFALWRAASIVDQILDSLNEAHAAGVLHRDLKPENIFLVEGASGREFAKVLDFGIAQLEGDGKTEVGGTIVGTPRYMSPEQMSGKPLDARSDLYALATILFELLAGESPFAAPTPARLGYEKTHKDPPKLVDRNPSVKVPEEIELFLRRALDRNPDERPPTAWEFKNLLALAVEGHADAVPPPAVQPEPRRPTNATPVGTPVEGAAAPTRPGDRRSSPRVRRMVAVRFEMDGKDCRATTVDIGRGGAFLTAKTLPAVGQRLEIQIASADRSVAVAPRLAEVVRVVERPSSTGEIRGFAVRWVTGAPGARDERTGTGPVHVDELFSSLR